MADPVITEAMRNAAVTALVSGVTAVSLHTGSPGAAGTLLELTVGTAPGYARAAATWNAAALGIMTNDGSLAWTAAGGNWPTVTHVAFWAGATFRFSKDLTTPRQANDGQSIRFGDGLLAIEAIGVEP